MNKVTVYYLDGSVEEFHANKTEVVEGVLKVVYVGSSWSSRYDVLASIPLTSIKKWEPIQ